MIEEAKLTTLNEQLIAYIPLKAKWEEIQAVMHGGLDEIRAALDAQNLRPTGPWFTHHHRRPVEGFDFEMCFPIAQPLKPTGRVKLGKQPATEVVQTVYRGGYEGLGEGWGQFCEAIAKGGYQVREDLYEAYVTGPESGDDASKYRTVLSCPIQK